MEQSRTLDLIVKKQIQMSIGVGTFYTNGIICYEFNNDIMIGVEEVKELTRTGTELTGGIVPVLSLVVTGERNNISTEAFSYDPFKELGIKQKTIAEAVVIKNLATRIMANFYYKIARRDFPVKVFDTKEEAVVWLLNKNFTDQ